MALRQGLSVDTVYVGGGTPSLLNFEQWETLMSGLINHFNLAADLEFTVECNPENVSMPLLNVLKGAGVNRLSLGLQTTQNELLEKIGRTHTWENFLQAYANCRASGFKNINVDLMFGLPGQTFADWQETVRRVLALRPDHLTFYPLDVEKRSAFYFDGVQTDSDLQADMYEWSWNVIDSAGYDHYEIFSYALPHHRCRHNIKYWTNQPCVGLGLSAAGYDGVARYRNTEKFDDYLNLLDRGLLPIVDSESLPAEDKLRESMLVGLRLKEGLKYTPEIEGLFGPVLQRLATQGYLRIAQNQRRVTATCKGWLLSNYVYSELLAN